MADLLRFRGGNTDAVVAVDIGTSSCKCIVFDTTGRALGSGKSGYDLHTDSAGAAELDPRDVWRAIVTSLASATQHAGSGTPRAGAVSFSSSMHSIMAVAADGTPLTKLLTYADTRSSQDSERLRRDGGLELYRRTGTPLHPMSPLAKLAWLRRTNPDLMAAGHKLVGIKEWVLHRLCGRWAVDQSIASATGMFDIGTRTWDDAALELVGISPELLSEIVAPTDIVGELGRDAAELGLEPGLPLVAGAADGCLANLGAGAIEPGVAAVSIGTSGAVRTTLNKPLTDDNARTFCYLLADDLWVIGGPVSNGGLVMTWVREELGRDLKDDSDAYRLLLDEAAGIGPGAEGLLFLPYLVGERAPHWDSRAKGAMIGLRAHHGRAHIVRAALEGVLLGLRSVSEVVGAIAPLHGPVRATGNSLGSRLWRQTLADVFNSTVELPAGGAAAARGAALLGMIAIGAKSSPNEILDIIEIEHRHDPEPSAAAVYDDVFERFSGAYDLLEPGFETIL